MKKNVLFSIFLIALIVFAFMWFIFSTKSNFIRELSESLKPTVHKETISHTSQNPASSAQKKSERGEGKGRLKIFGGTILVDASYGSAENELGLQKLGQPLGPADLFTDHNGQSFILDSINHRIMLVDKESGLKTIFSYPDQINFQSFLKHPDGSFLLLDNDGKQLIRYDEKGAKLDPIPLQINSGDYIRSLKTDHQGKIYAIGGKAVYGYDGQNWEVLPGQPFFQDQEHFIKSFKKGPDQYEASILNRTGKVEKTIEIEGPFDLIEDVFTDQRNRIYLIFSRVIQSRTRDANGIYQPIVNQIFIDVYSAAGIRINTIPLKREDYAEHERAIYIDSNGDLVRFVSDKNSIKVLKHNFDHSNVKYEDLDSKE